MEIRVVHSAELNPALGIVDRRSLAVSRTRARVGRMLVRKRVRFVAISKIGL